MNLILFKLLENSQLIYSNHFVILLELMGKKISKKKLLKKKNIGIKVPILIQSINGAYNNQLKKPFFKLL